MIDSLVTITAILLLFVGLPALILWLRDREGVVGWLVQKALGTLAVFFGVCILAWWAYNQFRPTPQYQRAYHGPATLLVPLGLIGIGAGWLRSSRNSTLRK